MTGEMANHLWQSTLFALVAACLTVAFRNNQARVRYWLWFSASLKFFVPFAVLIGVGSQLEWAPATQQIAAPAVASAIAQIGQPFAGTWSTASTSAPASPVVAFDWTPIAMLGVWLAGAVALVCVRFRMWLRIRAAVHASRPWKAPDPGMCHSAEVRSAPGLMEPGVVGWWRPILLVPAGIEDHLTPRQLAAVLAHELCHIRRRDNVTATIHMLVEAVFWFHPMVWWIGARLVEERERACDEDVLIEFGEPQAYAEGILNVCKRYAAARVACVSGVSGANLRKRIEAIMTNRIGRRLTVARRITIAVAGMAAVALPVVVGAINAPAARDAGPGPQAPGVAPQEPRFEVVSVKRNTVGGLGSYEGVQPGGRYMVTNLPVSQVIRSAYNIPTRQITGDPDWVRGERYDIQAKAPDGGAVTAEALTAMLQAMLADRFKLKVRRETRDSPVYELVVARDDRRLGENLRQTSADCVAAIGSGTVGPPPPPIPRADDAVPCGMNNAGGNRLVAGGRTIGQLATTLSVQVQRMVVDKTGLTGLFDIDLQFQPDPLGDGGVPGAPVRRLPTRSDVPPLMTAIEEQLGLKLQAARGAVEYVVIERVERPVED